MAEEKITANDAAMWRAIDSYTAAESAWLLMDKAPQTTWINETKGTALALACRVRDRFTISDYSNFGTLEMMQNAPPVRQRITFDDLCQFAEEIGLNPIICSNESAEAVADPTRPTAGNADKPPAMRDSTLIKVIAAMLHAWPGGRAKLKSGKDLEVAAQRAGIAVSDDSIRKAIALAEEEMTPK